VDQNADLIRSFLPTSAANVAGIDPGVAVCVVDRDGRPLEVRDIDRIEKLCQVLSEFRDVVAVVADIRDRRDQIEWSAKAFDRGYRYGTALGVCGAMKVPTLLSTAPRWEPVFGITSENGDCRCQAYVATVRSRLPELRLPASAARAVLLALYGVHMLKQIESEKEKAN